MKNNHFSKGTTIRLRILSWYQIIGGAFGILMAIWLLARTPAINGLTLLLILLAFGLYGFSVYCGKLLLGDQYNTGLKLSVINQALQIVSFLMFGYGFLYVAGMMIVGSIKYDVPNAGNGLNLGLNFSATSSWQISVAGTDPSFNLSVNFLAIYIVYFTIRLRERITNENAEAEAEIKTDEFISDHEPSE